MTRRPWPISRRLVLSAGVWILLSLSASGVALSYIFAQTMRMAFDENLAAQLGAVTAGLEIREDGALAVSDPLDGARYHQVLSGSYWQISAGGELVARSRSLWDDALAVPDARPGVVSFHDLRGPRDQTLRAAATAVNRSDRAGLVIIAAQDTRSLQAQVTRFNRVTFLGLGTLGAGLVCAVLLQVAYGLSPLTRLTAEIKAIAGGRAQRLEGEHPAEIRPLVDAFNDVLAHDQERLARTRRDVGNLAHALKTPLSQLTAEVDALPEALRPGLLRHAADLREKIDFHASRAATAAARGLTARRIDVGAVADDIIAALHKINADAPKHVAVDIPAGMTVMAEEEDLTEIVGNLLDNAYKWARSHIAISASERDGWLSIVVADDGPGVPDDKIASILRGARLDERVPGTGLGLQVVRDVVQAYGGSLAFERSARGGLEVRVLLPSPLPGA